MARLLLLNVAVAILPGVASASPGTCESGVGDCQPTMDVPGGQEGFDDSMLLQVSQMKSVAEASVEAGAADEWVSRRTKEGMLIGTWNLACFEEANTSEIAKVLAESGLDVIGTNEDVEFNESSQENALSIPGYTKVVACRAEGLWAEMKAYPLGGRWLQNAIYIRDDTVTWVRRYSKNISRPEVVGEYTRCTAVADVRMKGSKRSLPVRVASVHLSGGRFVDLNFFSWDGEKGHEIREALRVNPDVLMGDFNSYPNAAQVQRYQQAYEPYVDAKSSGRLEQYYGWTIEGTQEASRGRLRRINEFMNTTKYGGTVDHIYLLPGSGIRPAWWRPTCPSTKAFLKITAGFTLSDHAPVVASLI